jgi:peptidoglycan/xylan/chitin deacetylase (PgdA/CDA1 family)
MQRRIRNALTPGGLILMYHRIAEAEVDPWSLCISPSVFASQMKAIRKVASPMPLRELERRARERTLPARAVAVTFDDGYEDNAVEASSILKRLEIPATIFVTSDAVGSGQPFWWDELQSIFLQRATLPRRLRLRIGHTTNEWEVGSAAEMNPGIVKQHSAWKAFEPAPTERHRVYQQLSHQLRELEPVERLEVIEQLREWSGSDVDAVSGRPLSAAAVARLSESAPIEVGAHSRTHGCLSRFSVSQQANEIAGSKSVLEDITGRPVLSFAYPFGAATDFTPDTVALVRQAGFELACTSEPGAVRPGTNAFHLPRMQPINWSGAELAARVLWWARSQS